MFLSGSVWNFRKDLCKPFTPPKTNMDTQNDGLEMVTPASNMAIFGTYVKFLG